MIPFELLDSVPRLPEKKDEQEAFTIQADGIKIKITVEIFSDTREWEGWNHENNICYHLEFESEQQRRRKPLWEGQPLARPVQNPISETGYRSDFFSLNVDGLENYNFEKAVKKKIRAMIDAEEKRWIASKQLTMF
jgi:hypothetical protein